ncbi:hypothetical protein GCM10012279_24630 [Micromonospora yangpuensis]|nr:hypothetical protein GCM10012279_24630 [Micromonospora yangpuensis]
MLAGAADALPGATSPTVAAAPPSTAAPRITSRRLTDRRLCCSSGISDLHVRLWCAVRSGVAPAATPWVWVMLLFVNIEIYPCGLDGGTMSAPVPRAR